MADNDICDAERADSDGNLAVEVAKDERLREAPAALILCMVPADVTEAVCTHPEFNVKGSDNTENDDDLHSEYSKALLHESGSPESVSMDHFAPDLIRIP